LTAKEIFHFNASKTTFLKTSIGIHEGELVLVMKDKIGNGRIKNFWR